MKYFEQRFTKFVNISLRILFFLILAGSIVILIGNFFKLKMVEVTKLISISILVIAVGLGILYKFYKCLKGMSYKKSIVVILLFSFVLRIAWILLIDTKPFSDFKLIYECGNEFSMGKYWVFKGTSYIGRFTHLTMLTIYLGFFQKIFTNALLIIKIINVILSTISVYIIYLIGSELYENKKRGIGLALLASLFPPFIMYNSVVCSENIALPFFLGSIYIFMSAAKGKKNITWFLLSGLLLSLGNLFRMVAYVVIIAYIMYLIIYSNRKKLLKSCTLILISFFIPLYLVSTVLLSSGITEYPLWKGGEPGLTSVLKGTNVKNLGMWNEEDSKVPEIYNFDYAKVSAASKAIIKDRLTNTPLYILIAFYVSKFAVQWSFGDFGAVNWSLGELDTLNNYKILSTFFSLISQIVFIATMVYTYKGLFNPKQYMENKMVNLFYIIFCGYGLFYLITEQQPRYAYIVSWIFIFLSLTSNEIKFTLRRTKTRDTRSEVSLPM